MLYNRWTEFDKWCDEVIDNFKKNIKDINKFRRVTKSDDETFDKQIRHYEAGIKYYELRKEHYLETGDSSGVNVPEIKKAMTEMIERGYEYDPYSICIIMNNFNKEKKNDSYCFTEED